MKILASKIQKENLQDLSALGETESYFEDMIKCVVDIKLEKIAINAESHSDL